VRLYSSREVLAALKRAGFAEVSRRGSHIKLRHEDRRTVIVPDHREIARGTMRSILRQAGMTPEEFDRLV
jgi:predicted RNA binding protein YcfA (HicA-like mRNA interferase family)